MPDIPVSSNGAEPGTYPTASSASRIRRFLLISAGVMAGILVSVIVGGLLATVIVDLGGRIYAVVNDNPVVFGLVALVVVIGALLGGWVAYSVQDETPPPDPVTEPAGTIPPAPTTPPPPTTIPEIIWHGIRDVFGAFLRAIRALFLLSANTVTTLLPSTAFTSKIDESYSGGMIKTYQNAIDSLQMKQEYKDIITKNWLEQISWADNRATRERNVNEIIRWWQILLGVLIPALTTANETVAVGLMGIFVAFLTGIAQFRRPDENWRHYRILSENYQNEIWDFITLSGDKYAAKDPDNPAAPMKRMNYNDAFHVFHQKMTEMRKDDVNVYFGSQGSNIRPRNIEELRKEFAELQQLFAITGQSSPAAAININTETGAASVVTESASRSETVVKKADSDSDENGGSAG